MNIGLYGEFGWPELAAAVTSAYDSLSPSERVHAAVITDTYWQAGALDQPARDRLPSIHSSSRGFGYFEAPPDAANYICVGGDRDRLRAQFAGLEAIGRVDTRHPSGISRQYPGRDDLEVHRSPCTVVPGVAGVETSLAGLAADSAREVRTYRRVPRCRMFARALGG